MFIIEMRYSDGGIAAYGPFPTKERAEDYGLTVTKHIKTDRWSVISLTVPSTVVHIIEFVDG